MAWERKYNNLAGPDSPRMLGRMHPMHPSTSASAAAQSSAPVAGAGDADTAFFSTASSLNNDFGLF